MSKTGAYTEEELANINKKAFKEQVQKIPSCLTKKKSERKRNDWEFEIKEEFCGFKVQ